MKEIANLQSNEIFDVIKKGIEDGEDVSYFIPFYKVLSTRTRFIGSTLENEWFYRGRIATDKLFEHVNELKYPPTKYATKGRLNHTGEQIAYLCLGEVAPIVELDIGYYQLFCMAKIRHQKRDTVFYYVGVKGKYENATPKDIEVNEFYLELLTSKGSKYYNATIALGKHFLASDALNYEGEKFKTGIIYNSVVEDKTNKFLHNVAVPSTVFDECFIIEEATYYILAYDNKQDSIIMHDINKGKVEPDGSIIWDKSFLEMSEEINKRFSKDIFKISDDKIIHYKFGEGTIIRTEQLDYVVEFPVGEIIINIDEIAD